MLKDFNEHDAAGVNAERLVVIAVTAVVDAEVASSIMTSDACGSRDGTIGLVEQIMTTRNI